MSEGISPVPVPPQTPARRTLVALLASHNRRALTLRALASLAAVSGVFDLSIVLFEDGSTDGTADAVADAYPDTIMVHGKGNAFWNGGMYRAWQRALELRPDAYLWLNDDVLLDSDALRRLADCWAVSEGRTPDGALVLVGATRDASGALTYGGMTQNSSPAALRFQRLPLSDRLQEIETFNGNIVLVTAATVARVGIIDPHYFHKFGDIDYGLRAHAAGVPLLLLPGTLGICEAAPPFDLGALSLRQRWTYFSSHRGAPFASWWRMTSKYSGKWRLPHFLLAYRRMLYPAALLRPRK